MPKMWYCSIRGKVTGPFAGSVIRQMAATGAIGPEDLVRSEGQEGWYIAKSIKGLCDKGERSVPLVAIAPGTKAAPVDSKPIKHNCPDCDAILESPRAMAGQKDACPYCHASVTVPQAAALELWKIGLFAAAIAASMFAVDIFCGFVLRKLFEEITPGLLVVIELSLFCMLGMAIADCVYKLRKSIVVLGIAAVAFLLVRFLLLSILLDRLDGAVVIPIMGYSVVEIITVVLSTLGFGRLFRFAEPKFDFAEIRDIESNVLDPKTKKKYDMAVCGRCGARIKVARERLISGLSVQTEKHSCDNCGVFLRTSPFRAILHGSFECILSLMVCMFGLAIRTENNQKGAVNMIYLFVVFGIIDGGRRMFFGIAGVFKARTFGGHP